MRLLMAELKAMSPSQRTEKMRELATATRKPVDGEIKALTRKILAYETRFNMDSDTMREKVFTEELDETKDICDWLMNLNEKERLLAKHQI